VQVALEAGGTIDLSNPQTRNDLNRLSKAGLKAWIAVKGDRSSCGSGHSRDKKQTLLIWAQEVWDSLSKLGKDPSDLHVSEHDRLKVDNHIEPKAVQSRVDLDKLTHRDLRAWIRSKGHKFTDHGKIKASLLDLARMAGDNPENPPDLDHEASQKPLPAKRAKRRSTANKIKTPQARPLVTDKPQSRNFYLRLRKYGML